MTMPADVRSTRTLGVLGTAVVTGATLLAVPSAQAAAYRTADNGSKIVSVGWVDTAKTVFDFTVQSQGLGTRQKVRVIVPQGWSRTAARTWPVVYALHGGRDNYTSWTRNTGIEELARRWRVLVVMPEGANGSYTDWFNGGNFGRPKWETFHMREVRQLVERNFRAGTVRATMGLSSGGQGACTYPGRFPGMFRYAACFSSILSMRAPGVPALLMYTAYGSHPRPEFIWGNPNVPAHLKNWDKHDPIQLLPQMRSTKFYVSAGLTGQPGPFDPPNLSPIDAGRIAEPPTGRTSQAFVARARALGIPVTAHLYQNGTHKWAYWRREMNTAWPLIMQTLGAQRV
jgi:S-formylglutathione hydrolase FrmB